MLQSEDALVIPLWINGRAYLTVAPTFVNVRNPRTGLVLRRTPMCGDREALQAVSSAQAALVPWNERSITCRSALFAELSRALAGYASHFSALITEENGMEIAAADAEVTAAIVLINNAAVGDGAGVPGVISIIGDAESSFLSVLSAAIPALMAGSTVIVRPRPEEPSSFFALAELTGQCGFPAGVFNILHGGERAVECLRTSGVTRLFSPRMKLEHHE